MKNIRLLDCTLRDGGRIIDCNFGKHKIINILKDLQTAGIDIIEVGFIRNKIKYRPGTTFFTNFNQIKEYISQPTSQIVVFIDCGMFDIADIPERNPDNPVTGIRYGFTKGNFDVALKQMYELKRKGYNVFTQPVNTLGYSDSEILQIIDKINELKPYSFAIVDTYGAMYCDDVERYFELYDRNLMSEICIDFHSHNNYQLSFALAQEVLRKAWNTEREVIIDSTLYGMGKVAGNLNTELIVDFMNRKYNYSYDLIRIFDCIDENIIDYTRYEHWGYSTNALLSGIYQSHPNNVIYLTEKFKLDTKDVGSILSMIDDDKRKTYDYDNIERLYIEYNTDKEGDKETRSELRQVIQGKTVLIIAPGSSIESHADKIKNLIINKSPVIVSVNFDYGNEDYIFFANKKRYKEYLSFQSERSSADREKLSYRQPKIIVSSNVGKKGAELRVDYSMLVERGGKNFDNATIMLLRLLRDMDMSALYIAGFDGFEDAVQNFAQDELEVNRRYRDTNKLNMEIRNMFSKVREEYTRKNIPIEFLTESLYNKTIL